MKSPILNDVSELGFGNLEAFGTVLKVLPNDTDAEVQTLISESSDGGEEIVRILVMFPSGRPEDSAGTGSRSPAGFLRDRVDSRISDIGFEANFC